MVASFYNLNPPPSVHCFFLLDSRPPVVYPLSLLANRQALSLLRPLYGTPGQSLVKRRTRCQERPRAPTGRGMD